MSKHIDILIVTFNRRRYLEVILRNLKNKTHYPHRILIILNGSEDDTEDFLNRNEDLWDVLIKYKLRAGLGSALNRLLIEVMSDDFVVISDDYLIYNDGWLEILYNKYKEKNMGGLLPFAVPYPKENRLNYKPDDIIDYTSHAILASYRMQSSNVMRKAGGFRWKKEVKQFESIGFTNIMGEYKISSGIYLKLRMMDMDRAGYRGNHQLQEKMFKHFINTGEVKIDENLRSDKSLVIHPRYN